MWVSCPKCGKENSCWEDNNEIMFCGECEEKYQKEQSKYNNSLLKELEEKCDACLKKMGNDCDMGSECNTNLRITELRMLFSL